MALLGLLAALLVVLGPETYSGHVVAPDFSCLAGLPGDVQLGSFTEADTVCTLESLESCQGQILFGNVLITGSMLEPIWDLGAGGDHALSIAPEANVTASCFSVLAQTPYSTDLQMLPVGINTLLSPPFLRPATGTLSNLTLRDVTIWLGCDLLLEWQQFLCSERLPGLTEIEGSNVSIILWETAGVLLERVYLTCDANPEDVYLPACSMVTVDVVHDIQGALKALQVPSLPLVLTLKRGLDFTGSDWPTEGVRITANVTLSATLDSVVTVSFGLKTVLFAVDTKNFMTAFLSFRGCVLVDLPLSYLPLTHPRRAFGILSTGLWPVYREEVAMGLYNCTLILTVEEFQFWSYWLSILVSPIPSVRALGNWSFASGVQVEPSGDDYIKLVSYYGRYTTLVNVRYQVANEMYRTQQRNNILQITGDMQVPPTAVFQVRDSDDLLTALAGDASPTAAQYGQYIILTDNVTMANITRWSADGAFLRYPATITTWPSAWVLWDLQLWTEVIETLATVQLKDVVLANLSPAPRQQEFGSLVTGLWAFNISNWRHADQQKLSLQNVALVVPQQEVEYYLSMMVDKGRKGDSWINSFQVHSYDTVNRTWIYFSTLATPRFSAQDVNITSTVPSMFDRVPLPIPDSTGFAAKSGGGSSSGSDRSELLLFALLAITLPTAVGAALLTYFVLKRRRLSRLCCNGAAAAKQDGGELDKAQEVDEEDGKPPPPQTQDPFCCFLLPHPLRKSKYVNPLYEGAGGPGGEVVLTAVLGPTAHGRAPTPALPELPTLLGTGTCTAATDCSMPASPGDRAGPLTAAGTGADEHGPGFESQRPRTDTADEAGGQPAPTTAAAPPELQPVASGGAAAYDSGRMFQRHSSRAAELVAAAMAAGALYGEASQAHADRRAVLAGPQSEASSSAPAAAGAAATLQSLPRVDPGAEHTGAGAEALEQRLALVARQGSGGEATQAQTQAAGRVLDMQQLDRLRREIGDRHLEVQHSLGWGGCGVVYKGVWKGLQVAVKTVLVQGDSKPSRQFLTEAAISASLQHANIVTTYLYELRPLDEVDPGMGGVEIHLQSRGSDDAAGHGMERMSCWKLYIVQEYCELGTLKAAIDQGYFKGTRGSMPNMAFMLTIALDVALGLVHVHSKNVVHGDVTVSNVLLQTCSGRPQGCIAKVADFGLSVKFEASQSHGSHMYGGTPHYMAPERARGVLSKHSDIYSLGVCLWELYCGTPPWRRNAAGAHHQPLEGSCSSCDSGSSHGFDPDGALGGGGGSETFSFPRSCPAPYSSLVLSCLSAESQRRPTADAVAEALQRLQRRYG